MHLRTYCPCPPSIRQRVFDEARAGERLRFHLRQAPLRGVYYTDRFEQRLEAAGLAGLGHRQVWP